MALIQYARQKVIIVYFWFFILIYYEIFAMKLNSFSPITENDDELHLPELVYWASLGELAEVEKSLANGIDVNSTDDEGYSALQAAAENGYLDVVKLLVENGANVHYKGEYTALQLAEMAEQVEIIEYLKSL